MSQPLAGIVLAGGASRRMGEDKAALDLGGQPMLTRIVTELRRRCDPITVVATTDSAAYAAFAEQDGLRWVTDEDPGTGPLGALAAGLTDAAAHDVPVAFVCATDMPLLRADLVDELLAGLGADDDAVIAVDAQRQHPLAAIYRSSCAARLTELVAGGERRLLAALDEMVVHRVSVTDPTWLTNVNAPEDVHRLRRDKIAVP
ncbi:molybdenum cofactor guanylyltransferase [Williamsia deligens]|uniref:Probable molybdenum cofactor guanylyltransferase n=1 Tax=Williamsia deligens TaxID=321325 RepID=A0ABW3GD48_9NOCA|nr:molybdenum cofactor guanylyltransferase [Williamsia deligens]